MVQFLQENAQIKRELEKIKEKHVEMFSSPVILPNQSKNLSRIPSGHKTYPISKKSSPERFNIDTVKQEIFSELKQEETKKWNDIKKERVKLKFELQNQKNVDKLMKKKQENEKLKLLLQEQQQLRGELYNLGPTKELQKNLEQINKQKDLAIQKGIEIEGELDGVMQKVFEKEQIIKREREKAKLREKEIQTVLQRQKELEIIREQERINVKDQRNEIELSRQKELSRLNNVISARSKEKIANKKVEQTLRQEKKIYEIAKEKINEDLKKEKLKKIKLADLYSKEKEATFKAQMEIAMKKERLESSSKNKEILLKQQQNRIKEQEQKKEQELKRLREGLKSKEEMIKQEKNDLIQNDRMREEQWQKEKELIKFRDWERNYEKNNLYNRNKEEQSSFNSANNNMNKDTIMNQGKKIQRTIDEHYKKAEKKKQWETELEQERLRQQNYQEGNNQRVQTNLSYGGDTVPSQDFTNKRFLQESTEQRSPKNYEMMGPKMIGSEFVIKKKSHVSPALINLTPKKQKFNVMDDDETLIKKGRVKNSYR